MGFSFHLSCSAVFVLNIPSEFVPYLQFIGCNIDEGKRSFRKEYMNNVGINECLVGLEAYTQCLE